jgi:hypothetical protein
LATDAGQAHVHRVVRSAGALKVRAASLAPTHGRWAVVAWVAGPGQPPVVVAGPLWLAPTEAHGGVWATTEVQGRASPGMTWPALAAILGAVRRYVDATDSDFGGFIQLVLTPSASGPGPQLERVDWTVAPDVAVALAGVAGAQCQWLLEPHAPRPPPLHAGVHIALARLPSLLSSSPAPARVVGVHTAVRRLGLAGRLVLGPTQWDVRRGRITLLLGYTSALDDPTDASAATDLAPVLAAVAVDADGALLARQVLAEVRGLAV